jgi:hypothetical protein
MLSGTEMSDPQSQKVAAARESTSPINVATLSMDLFPLRLQPDLNQAAAGLVGVLHRLTSNAGSFVAGSQEDRQRWQLGTRLRTRLSGRIVLDLRELLAAD